LTGACQLPISHPYPFSTGRVPPRDRSGVPLVELRAVARHRQRVSRQITLLATENQIETAGGNILQHGIEETSALPVRTARTRNRRTSGVPVLADVRGAVALHLGGLVPEAAHVRRLHLLAPLPHREQLHHRLSTPLDYDNLAVFRIAHPAPKCGCAGREWRPSSCASLSRFASGSLDRPSAHPTASRTASPEFSPLDPLPFPWQYTGAGNAAPSRACS